ncbi:hypothetical protein DPMN_108204 [Dreissena polymorpha]|uniref:Uncharacterized protein n=1 Tax=Dreissena polymorpha TaxID=45954 RepID=A0A9D4QKQ4_DREPO|nr:hypothetical protein DPMN_108204 [Dreissena polymorpha]
MPRPRGGHVFQPSGIIFEFVQDIIGMNLLTKFHEDRTINVASRVLTRKKCPVPWRPYIIVTNLLTKFHEERKISVASRVLTSKNAAPTWRPYIIGMNRLTKFHEDWKINVASRVLTRFYYSHIRKNAPPLGSHVFSAKVTIFELVQYIIVTNLSKLLTRKNAPHPGSHVFQPTGIIFELIQDIIGMNLLTKFHEDQTINVASRVKNAPTLGSHVFQANVTIFELIQDIIETNLLTKYHEDWTINVASRELTRQMLMPHNGRRMTDKRQSQKLSMSTTHEHIVLR